ncbi:hypothetical protein DL93DRAFT_1884938 [Clavulina sp. PMI_390]|nr:hypothetical protein DL93DRAFT_1884938 [Clavulina sp. PMI_390]
MREGLPSRGVYIDRISNSLLCRPLATLPTHNPAAMLSPIPEILDKPQYIDVVAKFILEGSVSRSPDVYRGYRVRRVAITKSNRVQKVFHQTLVLEVEDGEGNHPSILHLLVAERCTIPCDYPKKREAQSYQAGGQDVPARVGSPRPGWNPSSASSDSTRDSLNIPYGDGRDSIRFLKSVYTPVKEFWNNTKGNPSSEFTAKSGVVFDFAGCPREAACSLTLHDVILAMNAVSLVAPRYQFVSTNCWWWAQCVLLLLLRLQFSEGPSLTLSDVQESERFFEKIENPRVLMQYPKYLRLRVTLNEELILRDTTRALAEFRALVSLLTFDNDFSFQAAVFCGLSHIAVVSQEAQYHYHCLGKTGCQSLGGPLCPS